MSKLYTARDIEALIAKGGDLSAVAESGRLTPMARDLLRQQKITPGRSAPASTSGTPRIHEPALPDDDYNRKPGGDP
mgnify:CR=1 FL=1